VKLEQPEWKKCVIGIKLVQNFFQKGICKETELATGQLAAIHGPLNTTKRMEN
jgi:hypothetical protein